MENEREGVACGRYGGCHTMQSMFGLWYLWFLVVMLTILCCIGCRMCCIYFKARKHRPTQPDNAGFHGQTQPVGYVVPAPDGGMMIVPPTGGGFGMSLPVSMAPRLPSYAAAQRLPKEPEGADNLAYDPPAYDTVVPQQPNATVAQQPGDQQTAVAQQASAAVQQPSDAIVQQTAVVQVECHPSQNVERTVESTQQPNNNNDSSNNTDNQTDAANNTASP